MTPLAILGCGYIGDRLARAALRDGRRVRVMARSTGRLAPLGALGAEVKYVDAATPKQFAAALSGLPGAAIVYAIPPVSGLPPGHAVRAALQAAYGNGASCFIYLSSSGLWGDRPDDDVWIDEDTPVVRDDPAMMNVLADEAAIEASTFNLRTVTLRLAPVYGPGRGVRARLRAGAYRILGTGAHAISRVHVDDVVQVVTVAQERAPRGSRYLVADDEPTTQGDYTRWLCERTGTPMPPSRELFEPGGRRVAHRNRRLRNTRLKRELAIELRYPTFREGEAAIEAEEAATGAPT